MWPIAARFPSTSTMPPPSISIWPTRVTFFADRGSEAITDEHRNKDARKTNPTSVLANQNEILRFLK
jgi:hypothetical protein